MMSISATLARRAPSLSSISKVCTKSITKDMTGLREIPSGGVAITVLFLFFPVMFEIFLDVIDMIPPW